MANCIFGSLECYFGVYFKWYWHKLGLDLINYFEWILHRYSKCLDTSPNNIIFVHILSLDNIVYVPNVEWNRRNSPRHTHICPNQIHVDVARNNCLVAYWNTRFPQRSRIYIKYHHSLISMISNKVFTFFKNMVFLNVFADLLIYFTSFK